MFKTVKGFKRADLSIIVEEVCGKSSENLKISELKDIIISSEEYKSDPEFVTEFFISTIEERKIQERLETEKAEKQQALEIEQAEKQRALEIEQAEKQRQIELEFEKLRLNHQLELAKLQANGQIETTTVESSINKRKFTLPRLEFRQFGGDIKEWLPFWSQFEHIDKDDEIAPEDKFQYLVQATVAGSRAREVVESFPPTSANYAKAVESLKTRFGRDDLLVEVYVRELLKLIISVQTKEKFSLISLYDKLESYLRALETLGVTTDKCASILYPMVESCFPEDFLKAWNRSTTSSTKKDAKERLNDLMSFLKSEVEGEERISLAMAGFGLSKNDNVFMPKRKKPSFDNPVNKLSTAAGLLATNVMPENKKRCIFCEGKHLSPDCFSARKMNFLEKQKILKEKRCCFACLYPGHPIKKCRAVLKCLICGKKHVPLMCPNLENQNVVIEKKEEEKSPNNDINMSNINHSPKVFLQTLKAKLISGNREMTVRLLLDSGSQKSYILKHLAEEMKYIPIRQEKIKHSLFGGMTTKEFQHNCYKIRLAHTNGNFKCNFDALDQNTICENIFPVSKGVWLDELKNKNIILTDVSDTSGEIQVLIGADVMGKLLTGRREVLSSGLIAIETYLGWTLMGKVPQTEKTNENLAMTVTSLFIQEASITDLWNLEVIGIMDSSKRISKAEEDLQIKMHFLNTVTVNEDGRYEVTLPWKTEHFPLPSYKELALKRLEKMTVKLKSDNLYTAYEDVFKEWVKLGIIEDVPTNEENTAGYYLPHRPVIKLQSSTTKIRPVFDASNREKHSPSLNQCLNSGPNLIELIPNLLLRFRERQYGITADIEKAFLQISVMKSDRNYLRFFWWTNDGQLKIFRHARVVFGVISSPFLLGAVIEYHLSKCQEDPHYDKNVMTKLKQSFYVDNLVTSVDEEKEMLHFKKEAKDAMAAGKFNLRAWECTGDNIDLRSNVLGISWDRKEDAIFLNLDWIKNFYLKEVTKRIILSITHKVFDPVGFASPVMLFPKLLLQKIWKTGISWDSEVDVETKEEFLKWFSELQALKTLSIPRWFYIYSAKEQSVSIHTFCDASQHAYAAAVFIRVETNDEVKVSLLAARSRVAPPKDLTIPRLELLAALIGARLCASVIEGLNYSDKEIGFYFWTDSTTALTWIQSDELWSVFVKNRVDEIRSLTKSENWRHVSGDRNPADLPSRGCSVRYFLESKWWEGPVWLHDSSSNWPSKPATFCQSDIMKEKRKTPPSSSKITSLINLPSNCEWCNRNKEESNDSCKNHSLRWYYRYFSSYNKIVRMIGWVRRFIFNCKQVKEHRKYVELSCEEYKEAENIIIKFVQAVTLIAMERSLKSLDTYVDDCGIIRLKTKLTFRKDTENFRRPVILPANHPVVERLIRTRHEENLHAKNQMLLNILREHYWVLNGRRIVRKIISKCTVCKRHNVDHLNAPTAPLPEKRVSDSSVFEIVGIDLTGSLFIKGGTKVWICLFTCAVYRAIHLELLSAISTAAFIQAFRRFIARRGRPTVVYCDNGTNFVGASNALNAIDWNEIIKFSVIKKIEWRFNPPSAPWWGGWWERLIGILKQILRKVLARAYLTYEELSTVLCDAESTINLRPITYISERDELIPLSPSLFLHDIKDTNVRDLDELDSKSLNRRLRYRQNIMKALRERFRSEYLGLLIQRRECKKNKYNIAVGDVVLIGCDNMKRMNWPLGRVIELIPGSDDNIRLARLQTANNFKMLRPVQRIFPLEVSSDWVKENYKSTEKQSLVQDSKLLHQPQKEKTVIEHVQERSTKSGRVVKIPNRLDW